MKTLITLILFMFNFTHASDVPIELSCPNFAGDFIFQKCPVIKSAYSKFRIFQPSCSAIGIQRVDYRQDGTTSYFGPVSWEVVGSGKILISENAVTATFSEQYFDTISLYKNKYDLDKKAFTVTGTTTEVISKIKDDNIILSYVIGGSIYNGIMVNLINCK